MCFALSFHSALISTSVIEGETMHANVRVRFTLPSTVVVKTQQSESNQAQHEYKKGTLNNDNHRPPTRLP
jgi:hypothetical protein